MAYSYRKKNQGYGQQGGYPQQQTGYQQQGGYQQQTPPPPPPTPEEFINERLDAYLMFMDVIKARGLDPADFAFGLTQWVTSYVSFAKKGK